MRYKSQYYLLRGILYILISTFAFAWMNLLARYLSDLHPLQVVFFRAFGTFVILFPYMLYKKVSILGTHRAWLTIRGVVGFLSIALFFWVIQRIPLGSAISIRYVAPAFSVLLAVIFLKEKVKIWQWIGLLLAIVGVFVLKGSDMRIDGLSFVLIMVSAVLLGIVFTMLRYLGSKEHFLTIINYFMVACMLGSLAFLHKWQMPTDNEWIWLGTIGLFGLVGQVFMTKAFQEAETNVIAPFKYMELLYALLLGSIFLEETYAYYALIGMSLIVVGMILNVMIVKKKEKSS